MNIRYTSVAELYLSENVCPDMSDESNHFPLPIRGFRVDLLGSEITHMSLKGTFCELIFEKNVIKNKKHKRRNRKRQAKLIDTIMNYSYLYADYLTKEEERIFRDHPVHASERSDILFGTPNPIKEFRRFVVMYNDCLKRREAQARKLFDNEEMKCLGLVIEIGHFLQKNRDHAALRFSLMNTMEEMFRSLSILIDDYPSRL